jgi:hypothetical protein
VQLYPLQRQHLHPQHHSASVLNPPRQHRPHRLTKRDSVSVGQILLQLLLEHLNNHSNKRKINPQRTSLEDLDRHHRPRRINLDLLQHSDNPHSSKAKHKHNLPRINLDSLDSVDSVSLPHLNCRQPPLPRRRNLHSVGLVNNLLQLQINQQNQNLPSVDSMQLQIHPLGEL